MIITRTKNGLFQVEVLAGYLREFDPSVMDDTIITTWSCPPWRSHRSPYISRMQGWVLLLSQVYICCFFPPRTPLLPADGDSLSREEVELVRRWRCSAGILETVSLPGLLLGGRGEVLGEEDPAQLRDQGVQGLCQKRAQCGPWGGTGEPGPGIRAPECGHRAAGPISALDLWSSRLGHRCEACSWASW